MGKDAKGQVTIDNPNTEQLDALIKRSTISVTEYHQYYNSHERNIRHKNDGTKPVV